MLLARNLGMEMYFPSPFVYASIGAFVCRSMFILYPALSPNGWVITINFRLKRVVRGCGKCNPFLGRHPLYSPVLEKSHFFLL